ncbi:YbfB/YjiJ family MFS transporter [Leekyejoonella antrihumi]|uniref:YbfB/YjiJ family MFS transporter n=1 Tax=Leekyejoonella antrihumi TaxID=1660198 RepID=A0A563E7N6_9MICO|nr:YbfB/YjiJ family MFS transporter [Leekyejoonella antrihumi]TWP38527.1 YbfB/YjiJ family MFS transporter [Leekyejoonella antrihumi]
MDVMWSPRAASGSGSAPSRVVLVAAGLTLGPVVVLGLARFAYTLLLPPMRADLGWSFAQAGAMNTANSIGYLLGALVAGPLIARSGSRRPFVIALVVTALSVPVSAVTSQFALLLALRAIAGVGGSVVFIAGAALLAALVSDLTARRSATLIGLYAAGGPGVGIVISALGVPPVLGLGAGAGWRWGWLVLGIASVAALAGALPAAYAVHEPQAGPRRRTLDWPVARLGPALLAYGLFGAGYIAYMTFIVAFIKGEGFGSVRITAFWAVLGAMAVLAGLAWGPALDRYPGGRGLAAALALTTIGSLLPLVGGGNLAAFGSAVIFGAAFLAVPTAVINLARVLLEPVQVGAAVAVLTVAFGIGQSIGPVLAGALSDGPGGVRVGLLLSSGLLAIGTLVGLAQRDRRA